MVEAHKARLKGFMSRIEQLTATLVVHVLPNFAPDLPHPRSPPAQLGPFQDAMVDAKQQLVVSVCLQYMCLPALLDDGVTYELIRNTQTGRGWAGL